MITVGREKYIRWEKGEGETWHLSKWRYQFTLGSVCEERSLKSPWAS